MSNDEKYCPKCRREFAKYITTQKFKYCDKCKTAYPVEGFANIK
jgi:ribosomal protein L37AE/L43A